MSPNQELYGIIAGTIFIVYFLRNYILQRLASKGRFKNKHCLVTGGSSGLGKAVAQVLLEKGANVTLVARNLNQLQEAREFLEETIPKESSRKVVIISADITKYDNIADAVAEAEKQQGPISFLFACAGSSKPGFFLEQPLEDFRSGMELNYFGTLNSVKAVAKAMINNNVNDGRIIMVSSTLGLMGMIGYSQYCPTKYAIRGLAECLRQEFLPYAIGISVYFVSTIHSPGFEQENRTKPSITKLLEDGESSDASPQTRARTLIEGVEKEQFFIASDFITDIFRSLGSGAAPANGMYDFVLNMIGRVLN